MRVNKLTVSFVLTEVLSSNDRRHRMETARVTRELRKLAWGLGRRQVGPPRADGTPYLRSPVMVLAVIRAPSGRSRRDAHNYAPTVKALLDGLVDAHVLEDDSDEHIASLAYVPGEPVKRRRWGAAMWEFELQLKSAEEGDVDV